MICVACSRSDLTLLPRHSFCIYLLLWLYIASQLINSGHHPPSPPCHPVELVSSLIVVRRSSLAAWFRRRLGACPSFDHHARWLAGRLAERQPELNSRMVPR